MIHGQKEPLRTVRFSVSLQDYESCCRMAVSRVKQKKWYKATVMGVFFIIAALGFMAYAYLRLRTHDPVIYLVALVLMLVGVYDLLYYPLLFERQMAARNRKRYSKGAYFKEPVTLHFYEDHMVEQSAAGENRVMWQSVERLSETPQLYCLWITSVNGIILPKSQMDPETGQWINEYLTTTFRRFGKDITQGDTPLLSDKPLQPTLSGEHGRNNKDG